MGAKPSSLHFSKSFWRGVEALSRLLARLVLFRRQRKKKAGVGLLGTQEGLLLGGEEAIDTLLTNTTDATLCDEEGDSLLPCQKIHNEHKKYKIKKKSNNIKLEGGELTIPGCRHDRIAYFPPPSTTFAWIFTSVEERLAMKDGTTQSISLCVMHLPPEPFA
ncbi:Uncharacterized protein APZ42_021676 [Daphnia magna]|uniref:Uncharacterized protein n=1 Tax=Daphnia magna TaxID=35525 RepID=A0A164WDI3_9CRUS|nr:Uncharacterized protein APZ42_021676 [Daphnia magna]